MGSDEVPDAMDKALARIHAQLLNVIHGRREVVDGVEIDLRHELLPRRDWRPNLSLTFGTTSEPPWQRRSSGFRGLAPTTKALSDDKRRPQSPNGQERRFRTRGRSGERRSKHPRAARNLADGGGIH